MCQLRGAAGTQRTGPCYLAEDVRFELTDPFEPSVFKTDAIGHSANLPKSWSGIRESNSCLNLGKVSFYHLTNPAFILTYYLILVVSVGFEPTALLSEDNTLAGCRFQPLIQLTELFFSNVMNTFTVHYTYRHIYDLINVRHINSPIVYQASINIYSFSIHYSSVLDRQLADMLPK